MLLLHLGVEVNGHAAVDVRFGAERAWGTGEIDLDLRVCLGRLALGLDRLLFPASAWISSIASSSSSPSSIHTTLGPVVAAPVPRRRCVTTASPAHSLATRAPWARAAVLFLPLRPAGWRRPPRPRAHRTTATA